MCSSSVLFPIAEILNDPNRNWSGNNPANEEDILMIAQSCATQLSDEYFELLRFSNGGAGDLALPPRWFVLFSVNEVLERMCDDFYHKEFPNFFFFGSNGGMEQIAFDMQKEKPYPIVMIDPIAGSDSAVEIASNINQFVEAIGIEYSD